MRSMKNGQIMIKSWCFIFFLNLACDAKLLKTFEQRRRDIVRLTF